MIEVCLICKDHIAKDFIGHQFLKIARAETFHGGAIVASVYKRPAADYGELPRLIYLDGHGKTMQTGMTAIMNNATGCRRARVGCAAVWFAKVHMRGRRL